MYVCVSMYITIYLYIHTPIWYKLNIKMQYNIYIYIYIYITDSHMIMFVNIKTLNNIILTFLDKDK